MIFYFTGTGNSLYAAKHLDTELVSIPQAMREKAQFHTDYFYMVLTYGNRHGGAAELAENLCRACGIRPSYINVLQMVDNWLPSFDMDEQKMLDKKEEEHLQAIKADIESRREMVSEVTEADRAAHRQFLENMSHMPEDAWQHLIRIGEGCIGCGICVQVYPSGSLHLEEGKAVHVSGQCQTCLSCVHNCPQKVIGLNVPEKNPQTRYRNEHISLRELIDANCQNKGSGMREIVWKERR